MVENIMHRMADRPFSEATGVCWVWSHKIHDPEMFIQRHGYWELMKTIWWYITL